VGFEPATAKLFMLCNVSKRESENIKERRKTYAARDFSDKYNHALFKYPIRFMKFLIISLKILIKFSI
jgi:hypothetical protein